MKLLLTALAEGSNAATVTRGLYPLVAIFCAQQTGQAPATVSYVCVDLLCPQGTVVVSFLAI